MGVTVRGTLAELLPRFMCSEQMLLTVWGYKTPKKKAPTSLPLLALHERTQSFKPQSRPCVLETRNPQIPNPNP